MTARIYHLSDFRPGPIKVESDGLSASWTTLSFGWIRVSFSPAQLRTLAEAMNDAVWSPTGSQHAAHGWVITNHADGFSVDAWGRVVTLTDLQFVALRNRLAARVAEVEAKEGMVRK